MKFDGVFSGNLTNLANSRQRRSDAATQRGSGFFFPHTQTKAKRRLRGSYYIPRPTANLLNIEHPKSWRDTEQGGTSRGARAGRRGCRRLARSADRHPPGCSLYRLRFRRHKQEAGGRGQRPEGRGRVDPHAGAAGPHKITHVRARVPNIFCTVASSSH